MTTNAESKSDQPTDSCSDLILDICTHRLSTYAFALAAVILAGALVFYSLMPEPNFVVSSGIPDYAAMWTTGQSSIPNVQAPRQAYLLFVLSVILIAFVLTLTYKRIPWQVLDRPKAKGVAIFSAALFALSSLFYYLVSIPAAILFSVVVFIFYERAKSEKSVIRLPSTIEKLLLIAIIAIVFLPGFFSSVNLGNESVEKIVEIQTHYRTVVGTGERIANNQFLFENSDYGMILPFITGSIVKLTGSVSMQAVVQLLRLGNLVSVLIMILLLLKFWGRQNRSVVLLAFTAILPLFHPNQLFVLFPNLALARSLAIPLTLLVMLSIPGASKNLFGNLCLGLLGGVTLLYNTETGIAANAGLLTYLFFSNFSGAASFYKQFLPRSLLYIVGLVLSFLLFALVVRLVFGYWLDVNAYVEHLEYLVEAVRSGLATLGVVPVFDPVAFLILLHTTFLLFISIISNEDTTYSAKRSFVIATCSTLIVWLTYYFNKVNFLYLQAFAFYYSIFIVVFLKQIDISYGVSEKLSSYAISSLAVFLIWVPFGYCNLVCSYPRYFAVFEQSRDSARKISGVLLPKRVADELWLKAETIKSKVKDNPSLMYVSSSAYLLSKLSNCYKDIDPMSDLLTVKRLENFALRMKEAGPQIVLIDSSDCYVKGKKAWQKSLEAVRKSLLDSGKYRISSSNYGGWEVWQHN